MKEAATSDTSDLDPEFLGVRGDRGRPEDARRALRRGYEGKSQIRGWYAAHAPAFRPENHWVPLTAPASTRIDVRANQAGLYFEVHYVDVRTRTLAADAAIDATLSRINGRWLIQDAIFKPASL